MDTWVLVDTCIWIAFFGKPQSAEKAEMDKLLPANRVALIGPILFETLLGFRRNNQADWVASRMQLVNYIPVEWEDWREAARLGRRLASKGHKLPPSDLVLATIGMRRDCSVYTTDPHFDLIPNLKRYKPGK